MSQYSPKTPQPLSPRGQWTTETRFRQQPADAPASASLADIEAGRIGGPAYEEIRPATPSAAHVPGTALPLPMANGHPPLANGHLTNRPRRAANPPPAAAGMMVTPPPARRAAASLPRRPRSSLRTAGARAARSSSPTARTTAVSVARCAFSPSLPSSAGTSACATTSSSSTSRLRPRSSCCTRSRRCSRSISPACARGGRTRRGGWLLG
ncbi:hypothetical protein B0H17DRAFT_1040619, partial [Mycena rosella]